MESLVGYGSDDDNENERYEACSTSVSRGSGATVRTKEDDTNYENVNMDLSEDSQAESEPELPPADEPPRGTRPDRQNESRARDAKERERDGDRRRDETDKREPRPDDKHGRYDRDRDRERRGDGRRGLLGDRPDDRATDKKAEPAASSTRSYDARDAVSPRFVERRDNRDKDRERERERDRDSKDTRERERDRDSRDKDSRDGRDRRYRPDDKRSDRYRQDQRSRSRDRGDRGRSKSSSYPPPESSSSERRVSPPTAGNSGDYRSTSYKVNKKLEVMEKMGLQIKTPDGSMATAQQLRRAAAGPTPQAPYFATSAAGTARILDQVQKRKLLWSSKNKSEAEEAAKWSGARFAQDNDGRQASKFMRLMGIKDPAAVPAPAPTADPIQKQEELFQAMQQQYEVARAATHTMRGVGLGFQRGQF